MSPAARASVVVVTHNSADCLSDCLGALARFFDFSADELVVVDNNSSDATVAVVLSADQRVQLIRNRENLGFARAVNMGIRASSGDYIVLVNPDVTSIEGQRTCIDDLAANPSVAAIGVALVDDLAAGSSECTTTPTPFTIISEDLALAWRFPSIELFGRHRMCDWDRADQRDVENVCGAFLVLTRTAIDRIGLLDERYFMYYEEADWLRRAREVGFRVVFTPSVRAVHAAGGSSAGSDRSALDLLLAESMYLYVRKWYGRVVELGMRVLFGGLNVIRSMLVWFRRPATRQKALLARRRLMIDLGRNAPHAN